MALLTSYLILNGNGWTFDDNLSLELARQNSFNWHWLSSNLFGHFEPAHRALFYLQADVMPIDFRIALVAMLACVGVSMLLLDRIVRMVSGDGWSAPLAAGYLGFSILLVPQLQWLSSGLEAVPTILCDLLCLWAFLRFTQDRRLRWLVICGVSMLVGLAFYEKPVFLLGYLVLLRLVIVPERLSIRLGARVLWEAWPAWLVLGLVTVLYVVARNASGAGSIASGGPAPLSEWLSLARVFWVNTSVPTAFGLDLPASGLSTAQVAAAVAGQVVLVAAVAVSLARNRRAWRAWLALALSFLATLILIGQGRLSDFGPSVGNDIRYLNDFTWLTPLLVILAFRPAGATPAAGAGAAPPRWREPWRVALAAGAVGLYLVASVLTALDLQRHWEGPSARAWETRVESLLRLPAARHAVVADANTPWYIVETAFNPLNRLSRVLPLYGPAVRVDGPLTGPLVTLAAGPRLQRASLASPLARVDLHGKCGTGGPSAATVHWVVPRSVVARTSSAYLVIGYKSIGPDRVPVYLDQTGHGLGAEPDGLAQLSRGVGESIYWLGTHPTHTVQLNILAGLGVCIRSLSIATLTTAGG